MGYFNYFIRCIIRNFAYKLCKPKVFLTVALCVVILFSLHSKGYCAEWSESDIDTVLNDLTGIVNSLNTQVSYLLNIHTNVGDIETQLNSIKTTLNNIKSDTSNISNDIDLLLEKITNINAHIINISNKLDDNQAELIAELQAENQKVLTELQQLRDALIGSEATVIPADYLGSNSVTNNKGVTIDNAGKIYIPMEYGYTYKIVLTFVNNTTSNKNIVHCFYDKNITNTSTIIPIDFTLLGAVPANSTKVFTITTRDYLNSYLYFGQAGLYSSCSVTASIEGVVDVIDRTNQEINNGIQEGNQLQQEQNDFLKQETSDSDVSVDSFNSVDANDITSDGLTGVFTNIYNSINNWTSKDINLPVPYTNQNITIPANYTQNMLSSFGGGWIITFISSIYYFIVARFIIYSITNIINTIKSGSILETDSKNNITTDML